MGQKFLTCKHNIISNVFVWFLRFLEKKLKTANYILWNHNNTHRGHQQGGSLWTHLTTICYSN